jgi:hypothetical protein
MKRTAVLFGALTQERFHAHRTVRSFDDRCQWVSCRRKPVRFFSHVRLPQFYALCEEHFEQSALSWGLKSGWEKDWTETSLEELEVEEIQES